MLGWPGTLNQPRVAQNQEEEKHRYNRDVSKARRQLSSSDPGVRVFRRLAALASWTSTRPVRGNAIFYLFIFPPRRPLTKRKSSIAVQPRMRCEHPALSASRVQGCSVILWSTPAARSRTTDCETRASSSCAHRCFPRRTSRIAEGTTLPRSKVAPK